MNLGTLLVVVLILAFVFGGYGHSQSWGLVGWSPAGVLLLVLVILLLTGNLRF